MIARRLVLCALLCAPLCAACGKKSANQKRIAAAVSGPLDEAWGIRAVSLRPTFGGTMLDFRFKVTDAEKARAVFDRKIKPYLLDPSSGASLGMSEDSKLGALRASLRNPPIAGKLYYVLFANGQGVVKRGSTVTVVMGPAKLEHVVVR
jgi:hypothetical protein